MMLPILGKFADEMGNTVKVGKVNVDENPSIAGNFRVMSIPTLILFKDGKAVEMVVGVQQVESLKNLVAKHSA
jgi:thioredoxin 1